MENENQMIHVCYGIHDENGTYSKILGTSMCSIFNNTDSYLTVHILYDDSLSIENRNLMIKLTRSYGQMIIFHKVDLKNSVSSYEYMANSGHTSATFYRLMLPEILTDDIKKIIYLDADTIVNLDIVELWNQSMEISDEIASICAVRDAWLTTTGRKILEDTVGKYIDVDDYFNAGVLVMNLEKIRLHGNGYLLHMADKILREHPEWRYYDQDILNYLFSGKCHILPNCYNHLTELDYKGAYKDPLEIKMIFHYVGIWLNAQPERPYNHIFWHYFLKTPWCDRIFMMKAFQCGYMLLDRQTEYLRKYWMTFHKRKRHIYIANIGSEKAVKTVCPFYENDYFFKAENHKEIMSAIDAINDKNDSMIVIVSADYDRWYVYLNQRGFYEEVDFFDGRCLFKPSEGGAYLRDTQARIYRYIMGM
ncbi:glycosyltransferase [Selenomonas sp. AB3002]|uniref:glycosyltransferase family 8 protein n=1 Tax=Selenomonas sp. AB3002 TaxID=1392502 RepID=UPI000495B8A9